MQIEEIREALHKQPFEPFSFLLADGSERYVPHPDFVALARRRLAVFDDQSDALSILDPMLILSIEYSGETRPPRARKKPEEGGNP